MSSYRSIILALGTLVIVPTTAFFVPPLITLPQPSEIITADLLPHSFHHLTTSASTTTISSATSVSPASISRIQFVVLLLFGSGPVISGWNALPQVRNEMDRYTLLLGENDYTLGGPSLTLTPIQAAFFPATEPLRTRDVMRCIEVCPRARDFSVSKLANPEATCAGRAEDLSKFVYQDIFVSTLVGGKRRKCNPMAAESLWQAVSGGTSAFASVEQVDDRIDAYRFEMGVSNISVEHEDGSIRLELFKRDLGNAKLIKIRSIATLALLMGGTVGLVLASGLKGFL